MKTRKAFLAITLLLTLVSICAMAGEDPIEKMKKKLVGGTWEFSNHWNPYNKAQMYWKSTDPIVLNTAYTFYEDGTVMIWSLNDQANPLPAKKHTWGIVHMEDSKGKQAPVIKIVDSTIDPKNQQAIESYATGTSFYVIRLTSSSLECVPITNYQKVNKTDNQNVYSRKSVMPKQ